MSPPRILAFAGSARAESFNAKLVRIAAAGAQKAGAQCQALDLREYPLPIYDGDLEASEGLPRNAVRLKELFRSHDGLLISTPEYNSSIPPLLKNVIDWVSRSPEAQADLSEYRGKIVALMAASPGPLGGLRALTHLRELMANIGCLVLPEHMTLRRAFQAFGDEGQLTDPAYQARAENVGATLASWVARSDGSTP